MPSVSSPPERRSGRTMALAGIAVAGGIAVIALVLVLGGAGALAIVQGGGETPDRTEPADVAVAGDPAVGTDAAPALAEEVASPVEVAPPVEVASSAVGAPKGAAARVAEAPVAAVVPAAAEVPVAAASCDDHKALEAEAMAGKLDPAARACLVAGAQDATRKLTDRDKLSRVVLANDAAVCAAGGSCAAYDEAQRYHFAEIDRSDPELLYAFTVHLYDHGGSRTEVIAWAERTLAERDRWKVSRELPKRIDKLYEMRARAAYDAWNKAPTDEKARVKAVNAAVDWMEHRGAAGSDPAPAKALCASAHGSEGGKCARVGDAEVAKVRFASVPMGVEVWVDGKQAGVTPLEIELTHGAHEVEMRSGDDRQARRVQVGSSQPTRYTWTGGTAWDDGY